MNKFLLYVISLLIFLFVIYIFGDFTNFSLKCYQSDVITLICGLVIFLISYCIAVYRSPNNLLQPLHIVFFFYLCIFFLTPLFMIKANEADCHDVNVMKGCKYGTFLVIIAFISFICGYKSKNKYKLQVIDQTISSNKRKKILKLSYFLFFGAAISNILLLLLIGYNLVYLMTFGGNGLTSVSGVPENLKMLYNVAYLMLVPWLFLCAYSKNKYIICLSSYVLMVIFFAYGWRFIVYIVVISGSILYFRLNRKTPKLIHLALLGALLFVYSTIGEVARGAMRSGQSVTYEAVDEDRFIYTLESNFDIYKTYYGVVGVYPEKYSYYYGKAMFVSPVIMWIPRYFWNEKPKPEEYPLLESMINGCGRKAIIGSGMASPNLTEYYIDFGLVGVLFFSYLLGFICRKMVRLYYGSSMFGLIQYSLFCGFLIQLINRGYMAQLMTLFIILYSPLFIYKKIYGSKN